MSPLSANFTPRLLLVACVASLLTQCEVIGPPPPTKDASDWWNDGGINPTKDSGDSGDAGDAGDAGDGSIDSGADASNDSGIIDGGDGAFDAGDPDFWNKLANIDISIQNTEFSDVFIREYSSATGKAGKTLQKVQTLLHSRLGSNVNFNLLEGEYLIVPFLPGYQFVPEFQTVVAKRGMNIQIKFAKRTTNICTFINSDFTNWCWENPLPQGESINAITAQENNPNNAIDRNNFWFVGDNGLVLRLNAGVYDNQSYWTQTPNPMTNRVTSPSFVAAWVSPTSNWLYALTSDSLFSLNYPGYWSDNSLSQIWDQLKNRKLTGIWGSEDADIWIVGTGGLMLRTSDSKFIPVPFPYPTNFRAIWGRNKNDVWFVGDLGAIWRWDGEKFTSIDAGTSEDFVAIRPLGPDNVGVVGFSGTVYVINSKGTVSRNSSNCEPGVSAIAGQSPTDMVVAGSFGEIRRFDSTRPGWVALKTGIPADVMYGRSDKGNVNLNISALWRGQGLYQHTTFVGGSSGYFAQLTNGILTATATATFANLFGIASAEGVTWAVGEAGTIVKYNPNSLQWNQVESNTRSTLRSIWATKDSAFAVGDTGVILQWYNQKWNKLADDLTKENLTAVSGSSPTDVWITGTNGFIAHYDGTKFTKRYVEMNPGQHWNGVWIDETKTPWIVGDYGTLASRSKDGTWDVKLRNVAANLKAVWGVSKDEVWVVGDNANLMRWTSKKGGSPWDQYFIEGLQGTGVDFKAIQGTAQDGFWVTGTNGALYHGYKNTSDSPTAREYTIRQHNLRISRNIEGIAIGPDGKRWITGNNGLIMSQPRFDYSPP